MHRTLSRLGYTLRGFPPTNLDVTNTCKMVSSLCQFVFFFSTNEIPTKAAVARAAILNSIYFDQLVLPLGRLPLKVAYYKVILVLFG